MKNAAENPIPSRLITCTEDLLPRKGVALSHNPHEVVSHLSSPVLSV